MCLITLKMKCGTSVDISLLFQIKFSTMPQAWNYKLTPFQQKAFQTLYGEARVREGLFTRIAQLVIGSKADGTVKCYIAAIQRWLDFAKRNEFQEFPPRTEDFSLYIADLSVKLASFATFKVIQAAFPFFYAARNCDNIPVSKVPLIKLVLEGAMREASKRRGPVKKADTLEEKKLREILKSTLWKDEVQQVPNESLKDWRTATKLYTYYKTMCRFDGWDKLKFKSYTFYEDYLIISFESSKNDQFYHGTTSVLGYIPGDSLCPFLIFKTYFHMMNLKEDEESLNCRLNINGLKSRPMFRLSYSKSLADTKELLSRFGCDGKFSEKTFKSSAVTIMLDKGAPLVDVQVYGRWNSERTPLSYHNSSVLRRKQISKML